MVAGVCYTQDAILRVSHSSHLKVDGWKMIHFLLRWSLLRGHVNFRGCTPSKKPSGRDSIHNLIFFWHVFVFFVNGFFLKNLQQDPRFTDPEKPWVSNSSRCSIAIYWTGSVGIRSHSIFDGFLDRLPWFGTLPESNIPPLRIKGVGRWNLLSRWPMFRGFLLVLGRVTSHAPRACFES